MLRLLPGELADLMRAAQAVAQAADVRGCSVTVRPGKASGQTMRETRDQTKVACQEHAMLNLRSPAGIVPELLPSSSVFVRVVVALLGTAVLSALALFGRAGRGVCLGETHGRSRTPP